MDGLRWSRFLRHPFSSSYPPKLVSAILAFTLDWVGYHGLCCMSTFAFHIERLTDDVIRVGMLARSRVCTILHCSGIVLRPRPAYAVGKESFCDCYAHACPGNEVHSSEFDSSEIETQINKYQISIPTLTRGWRAGQHVRVRVLSMGVGPIGWAECHPFTVCPLSFSLGFPTQVLPV